MVRTQNNLRSYLWKKPLLKKEQKEYLKGEVGQVKRGTGAAMMIYRVFQAELLCIHLSGHGLTVLIDSC